MADLTQTIHSDFLKDYTPFIEGPDEEHRQFIIQGGDLYCVRKTCDGCSYYGNGCEVEKEEKIQIYPMPHARRGLGMERRPFLVLKFLPGVTFFDVPEHLREDAREESLEEANIHFLLQDFKRNSFMVLKGQIRLYNHTPAQFEESEYAQYFSLYQMYDPMHMYISADYSAVEPRIATCAHNFPLQWRKAFVGEPRPIFREIVIAEGAPIPKHTIQTDTKLYCHLVGELDKVDYVSQCKKCPAKESCKTKQDFMKNIPLDWHGTNRKGLYGKSVLADVPLDDKGNYQPRTEDEKYLLKDLRDISKIVGLALCYGGSAWTVSANMHESVESAQMKIDDFFSELPDLQASMAQKKRGALESGYVYSLFGRARSVKADLEMGRKGIGYAERTALNHPIQSTAGEVLKIGMIRLYQLISDRGWNPIWGPTPPMFLDPATTTYWDIKFSMISSVHDELVFFILDFLVEEVIPQVYEAMQVQDIMDMWKSGFSFESDVEYDDSRSWTSTNKLDNARIYLLRHLRKQSARTESSVASHNTYSLKFEALTREVLAYINSFPPLQEGERGFQLAVIKGSNVYKHHNSFPQSFFDELEAKFGVDFTAASM